MGKISQSVISAITLDGNNLVDWRLRSEFEEKAKNSNERDKYEKTLFDFFRNLNSDKESFNVFIEYFGKKYPLIAYLIFIKDKAQ